MKKILFLFFILHFFSFCVYSQKHELGRVTKEELSEKSHPRDTSAVAAMLFKKAKTVFHYSKENGFVPETEFSIKIKIYKKEGINWANFEIAFFTGYEKLEDDMLDISQAFTYNLENGKIDKMRVTSEGKYVEKFNESWKSKSITFPNVKAGSIIELKYKLKSQNISILPDFQYQHKIPVNYAEYITEIPQFFIYKAVKSGFVPIEMKEKLEPASQSYQDDAGLSKVSKTLTYNQVKTSYIASQIPALTEEEYVDNIKNYFGKLEFELQTIQYPDKAPKQFTTTWENVAKLIFKEKDFGPELLKFEYFFEDLKRELGTTPTDDEKVIKVLNFVKKRMNWNGRYGYFTKNGVEKAYLEKTGNVAEINLILTAALRMAGLRANPVLISTRNNGIALFPNMTKFNYVIAAVELENNLILLDATNKNTLPNILPTRDLNWVGRMIKNDGSSTEVDLMPKVISKDVVNIIAAIDNKGMVSGKLREQYFDYNAFVFRDLYGDLAAGSQLERVERKYKTIEVEDYSLTNSAELDKPLIENYSFKTSNSVDIIGDKMYFSPLFFLALAANPFKQEIREYPIDFAFPNQRKYQISITIPDGYQAESLPKSASIPMSSNLGALKYMISNNDKVIQVSVILDINYAVISADYYNELKAFFTEVVKKETEKIVLKKV